MLFYLLSCAELQSTGRRDEYTRLPLFPADATMRSSMSVTDTQQSASHPSRGDRNGTIRPRVGIPWRTLAEQKEKKRDKLDLYFEAIRRAGGEPTEICLDQTPQDLARQLEELDAFVLPGSPADVDPARYGVPRHAKTKTVDENRDRTDEAVFRHAFHSSKPVLAICYGCQMLNVHLHGTLIQDIRAQNPHALAHGHTDLPPEQRQGDAEHAAKIELGSRLAKLNGGTETRINSSHHQAIDRPGENLRVTARAPDGTFEGIEWTSDSNWVVGVQWHPERMLGDAFSQRLFRDFVAAADKAREVVAHKT